MIKMLVFCTLMACALSAPTDKQTENTATSNVPSDKSLIENSIIGKNGISVKASDKREKREGIVPASSSTDNKRSQVNSQPDYPENKPPTFVHPVPVDQIIKHSHAAPEIHSDHKPAEDRVHNEEASKGISDDDSTQHHDHLTHNRKKIASETSIESDDDHRYENHEIDN